MDPALSEKMGITKKSYSQMLHCGFLVKVISSTEVLGLSSGYLYDRPVLITPPRRSIACRVQDFSTGLIRPEGERAWQWPLVAFILNWWPAKILNNDIIFLYLSIWTNQICPNWTRLVNWTWRIGAYWSSLWSGPLGEAKDSYRKAHEIVNHVRKDKGTKIGHVIHILHHANW